MPSESKRRIVTPAIVRSWPPSFQLEGIDCAHAIRDKHPGTGVVVLSAHDDEAYAIALLGKGQSGLAYLLKDRIAQGDELVRAIREVAAGGSAVDPAIAERLSARRAAASARPTEEPWRSATT